MSIVFAETVLAAARLAEAEREESALATLAAEAQHAYEEARCRTQGLRERVEALRERDDRSELFKFCARIAGGEAPGDAADALRKERV